VSPAADVARAYFAAIAARDPAAVAAVFAPDAELVTAAGVVRGADAIAAFYRDNAFANAQRLAPRPGPLLVDGDRLAVEIELGIDDASMRVADFFTFTAGGDRIRRLAVYLG
jgi:uncharacterized protein (TIGR02246 family)